MYQLCLGEESLPSLVDRVVARACATSPSINPDSCRRLVELVFRSRMRSIPACGTRPQCRPIGSVWNDAGPAERGTTCEWKDPDPEAVPEMFGAAIADLSDVPRSRRHALEERLAHEIREVLRDVVYVNPNCGRCR